MAHGVKEGSILWPLLFFVYVNDVPLNIHKAKLVLYADDTNILVTGNDEETLQAKLSSVMKQLEVRFLNIDIIVNTTKTVAKLFYLCQSKPPYISSILLQNTEIAYMSEVKCLGMYITENLSWQAHIRFLCHSLSKTYYIIKFLKNILNIRMPLNIYFAYFQLQLRYGIILWEGTRKSIKTLHIQKGD
jgi:hypothetical protein